MRQAERTIRALCHEWWQDTQGMRDPRLETLLDFGAFRDWLYERGYGVLMNFEPPPGGRPESFVQRWFEDELRNPA